MDRDARHWDAVEEATELILEKRLEEALLNLRDVVRRDPANEYAYYYIGQALEELEQHEPARDAYAAAVRVAPNYLGARVALSHTLRKLGDLRGALREAEEALRRFPKDAAALHAVGLAEAARGHRGEARENLQLALDTHPEMEAQLELRSILEMLGIGPDDEPIEFD
jgi:tetratricopeptide (TPR) repeat protein